MESNEQAVDLFTGCQTQWRHAGMDGAPIGLDYAGVQAAMTMLGIEDVRDCFERLQIVEAGAVGELRKIRDSR